MAITQSDFVATFSQMFSDMFVARYQEVGSMLRGRVNERHGLVGDAYKLKYIDYVQMQKHGAFNADIPATSVTTTAPSITFDDYDLKTSIDEFEQLNFNADALRGYAKIHADALGRREDQFVIDALVAGATKTVAAGTTNMTIEKIRDAFKQLIADGVRDQEKYLVMHVNNAEALLAETEYASSIFNDAKPLVNPNFERPFMGFNLIVLGDYPEGGLPLSGGVRKCFAFAKDAVTLGYRKDAETRMIPIEQNARTEMLSLLSAGAVVGDARGVVQISCDES